MRHRKVKLKRNLGFVNKLAEVGKNFLSFSKGTGIVGRGVIVPDVAGIILGVVAVGIIFNVCYRFAGGAAV